MKQLHDKYFKLAKKEGRLARSYYKLEELDRRNKLFKKGDRVLDIGATPGSWLEYILSVIGRKGVACAVDIKPIHKKFKGIVTFSMVSIHDLEVSAFADVANRFDVIVSDMAPNTSGVKLMDQAKSLELCEAAFRLVPDMLEPGGAFVCKVLEGPDFPSFRKTVQKHFREIKTQKPDASRDESMETYLVGLGFGEEPVERRVRPPKLKRKRSRLPGGKPASKKRRME